MDESQNPSFGRLGDKYLSARLPFNLPSVQYNHVYILYYIEQNEVTKLGKLTQPLE